MKREEVKQYNGKDKRLAYIIYKDKVYDVTESRFWKNGIHMSRHRAGEDLTDFISMAPHGEDLLKRDNIKYVCDVEKEREVEDPKERLRKLYSKYHPHPVFIHYPMGILYFGAFMLLLYLITGYRSFEISSFYALICGTLSIFPAVLSGLMSWWLNYDMTTTKIFKNKIIFSILLIIITVAACIMRMSSTSYVLNGAYLAIYATLYFISIPVLTFIAYNGGKITWPN
ncbi:MAG: cytochrome b5 [Deferribacterales bacterium]|nr:cytochrome b5 [Deferribacterales bacterium]